MTQPEKFIGTVSWPPSRQACYLRVSIPTWERNWPLSIKASFCDFDHHDFMKGDVVEVERSDPRDARRYRVLRLLKEVKPKKFLTAFQTLMEKRDQTMSNQKHFEHVRFTIGSKYFESYGFANAMDRAFGTHGAVYEKMQSTARAYGTATVVCRPSQFARFLIYRNDAQITNGFKDLNPKLFTPKPQSDAYAVFAKKVGITYDKAKEIAYLLGYGNENGLMLRVASHCSQETQEFNVSGNKHIG